MRENLKDQRIDMIRTTRKKRRIVIYKLPSSEENMNIVHNSAHRIFFQENSGIDLNLRKDSDNLYSEKDPTTLEIYAVLPSVMCSPGVARLNMEERMKFSMDMQKSPRQMSVAIKKNLWRTEEIHDPGAASMRRGERI